MLNLYRQWPVCLCLCVCALTPSRAAAQTDDGVGVRAQGMAGAFTAVADDASATWWNAAGLAGGAYFSAIMEIVHARQPRVERTAAGDPKAAWKLGSGGFAVAYPALGLSYYRLRINEIAPIVVGGSGRQDPGTADVRLRTLAVSQFGATVGQSIGNHLVIASTLKLVRGSLGVGNAAGAAASLEAASELEGGVETHTGLDLGAMIVAGRARVGLSVRNIRPIEFGSGDATMALPRHARAGIAFNSAPQTKDGGLTVALDADLTTTSTVLGEERRVAAGVEAWTKARVLGVRGGVGANTVGSRRASFSGGISAAVRTTTFLDLSITRGGDESRHGWAGALRVTF